MKNGVSQIREALEKVGGETVRIAGRNNGKLLRPLPTVNAIIPLAQKDFGFFPLLEPKDQKALIEKVRGLWSLLRRSASHTRALKNEVKKLKEKNAELEEKYIGLSGAWNDHLISCKDLNKDR